MQKKFNLSLVLVTISFLVACSSQSTSIPATKLQDGSLATDSPTKEPTVAPTEIPKEIPTEAANGAFRDDFDVGLYEPWMWVNEDSSRWQITDEGWLQITADDPSLASETTEIPMVNLLTRPIPHDIDISVTTHIVANPDEDFEQASLALIEDGDSYVLVNFGFCSSCANKSIYLEAYSNGQSLLNGLQSIPLPEDQTEVWLRLEHSPEGNATVALVALSEGDWQQVGPIVRNNPVFNTVAIGAANVPGPESSPEDDLIAKFDFLEITVYETSLPPATSAPTTISPESISALCTLMGRDPTTHISRNTPVIITWGWSAKTESQINDYLENNITTITLDGKIIEGVIDEGRKRSNDLFEVVWVSDIRVLDPGQHTITYNVKWNKVIDDGTSTYGPGGKIETLQDECQIIVD